MKNIFLSSIILISTTINLQADEFCDLLKEIETTTKIAQVEDQIEVGITEVIIFK
jgi:hypothetical protein